MFLGCFPKIVQDYFEAVHFHVSLFCLCTAIMADWSFRLFRLLLSFTNVCKILFKSLSLCRRYFTTLRRCGEHDCMQGDVTCDLPNDIIRFHLLPFLTVRNAVKLAQTSCSFSKALCHTIYSPEFVTADRFIQQSQPLANLKHITICQAVSVSDQNDLNRLLHHIEDATVNKVSPLLHLYVDSATRYLKHNFTFSNIRFPETLHTLEFNISINEPLPTILPSRLHTLKLGSWFNHPLPHLPINLDTLALGRCFNHPLPDVLPPRLHTLELGYFFDHPFPNILPLSLRNLIIPSNFDRLLPGNRPDLCVTYNERPRIQLSARFVVHHRRLKCINSHND